MNSEHNLKLENIWLILASTTNFKTHCFADYLKYSNSCRLKMSLWIWIFLGLDYTIPISNKKSLLIKTDRNRSLNYICIIYELWAVINFYQMNAKSLRIFQSSFFFFLTYGISFAINRLIYNFPLMACVWKWSQWS